MALPITTGTYDRNKNSFVPGSTGTWANLSSTTWSTWKSWNFRPANNFIVTTDISDRGRVGYFNLKTTSDVSGNISYTVYTSNTGAFAGEEVSTQITPFSSNLAAFCGRYYAVAATVSGGTGTELRSLEITSTDQTFSIDYNDLDTQTLSSSPWESGGYVLPLTRTLSAVTNILISPHAPDVSTTVYTSTGNVGYVLDFTATANTTLSTTVSAATNYTGYVAMAVRESPYVLIYKTTNSGVTLTQTANVANTLGSFGESVSWNSAGTLLVAGSDQATSPNNLRIYKRTGDTFTKEPDVNTWPTGNVNDVAWTRTDNDCFAVAHNASPYLSVYAGSTYNRRNDPATLPTGSALTLAWSPDDQFLAVGHINSPYISVYSKSGNTLTKVADPAQLPPGAVIDCAWSAGGNILVCTSGAGATATLTVYQKTNAGTLTKISSPAYIPPIDGTGYYSVNFNTSGNAMAIGWSSQRTDSSQSLRFGVYRNYANTLVWANVVSSMNQPVYDICWGGGDSQILVSSHDITIATNPGFNIYDFNYGANTVTELTGIGSTYAGNVYGISQYNSGFNNYLEVANAASFVGGGNIRVRNESMTFTTANTTASPNRLEGLTRGITEPTFGATVANTHPAGSEVYMISSMVPAQYFANSAVQLTAIGYVGTKNRTKPTILLRDQNSTTIQGVFDARLTALPEQYMNKTDLGTR